ncbi:MAG TPA: hypothetical protein ENH10_07220 [Bacteroidetes bacterium]|nr:hypothetical protein [Bacteroidota bacterium]HEX04927.1 hypothetical protein [Bacteroidota bacterium]
MSPTVEMYEKNMPSLEEIEAELKTWEERINSWADRIPWSEPEQRGNALTTAKFLRKLVAESWIHLLACRARGANPMDDSAFSARRIFRQLNEYAPSLIEKMESRLPESVPGMVAA